MDDRAARNAEMVVEVSVCALEIAAALRVVAGTNWLLREDLARLSYGSELTLRRDHATECELFLRDDSEERRIGQGILIEREDGTTCVRIVRLDHDAIGLVLRDAP